MTSPDISSDVPWMQAALSLAQAAGAAGEVPVGAVVVHQGQIIGVGRNAPIQTHDPTAHAEIAALRDAARHLGNYRLDDCELYVTLEPCTMCAGAMLHARLKRVVFGAPDPKTGAAGSVSDVFANARINHHTRVQGGVLQDACAGVLQEFFRKQRAQQQVEAVQTGRALREDALRTPQSRFFALPALPAPSFVIHNLPSLKGLRMHYVDSGPAEMSCAMLYLHGAQEWSHVWRGDMERAVTLNQRVICPDLIGFGKSDKPKKQAFHTLDWHAQVLFELIQHLNLKTVQIAVARSTLPLAKMLRALAPENVESVVVAETDSLSDEALQAPFPDQGHRAGPLAFASLKIQPVHPDV